VSISDEELISLIYEVQHSHVFQVEASDLALVFPIAVDIGEEESFGEVFRTLFTEHPLYQRLEFTVQHYTTVAEYIMLQFLDLP